MNLKRRKEEKAKVLLVLKKLRTKKGGFELIVANSEYSINIVDGAISICVEIANSFTEPTGIIDMRLGEIGYYSTYTGDDFKYLLEMVTAHTKNFYESRIENLNKILQEGLYGANKAIEINKNSEL